MAMAEPTPVRGPQPVPSGAEPSGGGGGGIKAALTRKIGPLPAWGWAVVIGGAGLGYKLLRGGGTTRQEVPTTNITPGASPAAGYLNELSVALKRIEDAIGAIPSTITNNGQTPPASASSGSSTTSPSSGTSSPAPSSTATSSPASAPISAKTISPLVEATAMSAERTVTRAVQRMLTPVQPVSSVDTVIRHTEPQAILGPTAGVLRTDEDILREETQAIRTRIGQTPGSLGPSVYVPQPTSQPAIPKVSAAKKVVATLRKRAVTVTKAVKPTITKKITLRKRTTPIKKTTTQAKVKKQALPKKPVAKPVRRRSNVRSGFQARMD